MWAIVKWNPQTYGIDSVMIAETRDDALDRAVLLAAAEDLFNRDDEAEEARVKDDLDTDPSFGDDRTRIALVRAFRA